jgi:hypothetical protein
MERTVIDRIHNLYYPLSILYSLPIRVSQIQNTKKIVPATLCNGDFYGEGYGLLVIVY